MKVRIPSPLFSYTKNRAMVEADGSTLDQLTKDLDRQFPGIRFRVIDEQNQIRPHVKFFLNSSQIRDLSVAIKANDEIAIVQSFSGG